MLQKGEIPQTEPLIRVGIILPEDQFRTIHLEIPDSAKYIATSENGETISNSRELIFVFHRGSVLLNNTLLGSHWKIQSDTKQSIGKETGIRVKNVVAGRGFHWQKHIDVFLPGKVEIAIADSQIILTNELPLEHYLMCVATSEMGAACPESLIEAQTIVARSWMLANVEQKHIGLGMDVCNDDCCQRYQGTGNLTEHSISGALKTSGQVLLYQNKICDARYSKSCGGIMESFPTIWGGNELPYMKNLPDSDQDDEKKEIRMNTESSARTWIASAPYSFCSPQVIPESSLKKYLGNVDEDGKYYRWHLSYTQEELCSLLNERLNLKAKAIIDLKVLARGGSGRIIKLEIIYTDRNDMQESAFIDRDVAIRKALHAGFLYSSCIYFEKTPGESPIPAKFTIYGAGWGHGAGLCQIGALGMSLNGYSAPEIVAHYYPGSELVKIY